jgi:sugar/nucleoside kinase (ribokinase family)
MPQEFGIKKIGRFDSMNKRGVVLGQGATAMDVVIRCSDLPKDDGFAQIYDERRTSGGSGANVLVTLAQLGVEASLVARIGEDSLGEQFRRELLQDGVSDRYLQVNPGGVTMYTYVFVADKGKRSIFVNSGDSFASLKAENVKESMLDGVDVFFTDGYPSGASLKLARTAKSRKVPVFLQLECMPSFMEGEFTNPQDLQELLGLADLICSGDDAYYELSEEQEENSAVKSIYRRYHPSYGVICTMGEQGAIWFDGEDMISCPVYSVDAVDTTGAGDSFVGAMIYSYLLQGMDRREALRFASACAAMKCLQPGPRFHGSAEDVLHFIKGFHRK